ncbi:DNA-3-methyladenine glycosylase [Secundilactobacillus kimchicus]|uniref:DNA-3-methyladenine glycosylase n=1 Tax=Secundilactobacillus kimchicus TaxID=528209 RepID=UPI0024A8FF80|nr:DNA-3-methyladenine glycosylase [Secundilactobacillus kimchicus]
MTALADFFSGRPTPEIAQAVLGKQLIYEGPSGPVGGLIVEAEAYLGPKDSAAHAYRGHRSPANEALYDEPGTIYIYSRHGQYLFDIAVQEKDNPQGVLIRGLEPTIGVAQMAAMRGKTGPEISNGPGKLMAAFGIHDKALNRQLLNAGPLQLKLVGGRVPARIATTARIGVSQRGNSTDAPYRFYVAGNPYVSKMLKRDVDQKNHGWQA